MSKHNHKIPSVLVPVDDICVKLYIPNHRDYIALLLRQIRQLELDRLYERDESLSAVIVREQWQKRTITPLIDAIANGLACDDCGDCADFEPDAEFISYSPQNPHTEPELVPDGYLTPPFTLWSDFESFLPDWADDWISGLIGYVTGYQQGDVIVDISSLPLFANWEELLTEGMPTITINVTGTGTARLHLLAFPLGGRAIITVDNPPDLGDIFGGIIGNDVRLIELNRDIVSIPPELDLTEIEEIEINTSGEHTIYIVFVPAINDELIPISFGGGFRKVELCGFGVTMPIDCGDLEDCLEESETINDIEDAIDGLGNGAYNPQNVDKPLSESSSYQSNFVNDLYTPASGCDDSDKNKLWSIVSQLVDFLDAGNQALIASSTENLLSLPDGVSKMIASLPLFGGLNAPVISDVFSWILNSLKPNYASAVTMDFLNSVKCEIFCMAVDNSCVLNMQDVLDLIATNAGAIEASNSYSFESLIAEFLGASPSAEQYFWQVSQLQIQTLALGENFGDKKGLSAYLSQFAGAADALDNGWKFYCADCFTPPTNWEIVLDIANDYVPTGDEIVIRNAANLIAGTAGTAIITIGYGFGMHTVGTSTQEGQKSWIMSNSPFVTFLSVRVKSVVGDTQRFDFNLSNAYNFPAWTTTNTTFGWQTDRPPSGSGGANLNYIVFRADGVSVPANSLCGQIRLKGTGDLPIFALSL